MNADFEKFRLKNGLTVLMEHRKLPVVSIIAAVKYGSAYENAKMKGIAHSLEHAVFKGTKTKTQKQIASIIEKHGGEINAATAEELTFFYSKIPSRHINLGIDIISDITLRPLLRENLIEQEKKVILQEINLYHDRPELYVTSKIKSLLYESPFGMDALGSKETVTGMSRKELVKVHSCYNPKQMVLALVGNVDKDEILKSLEKRFSRKINFQPQELIVRQKSKTSNILEMRPGLDQAHICFGFTAPSLNSKERYSAEILNSILGAGMSSWLWQEIREKRGLAYTVTSHLNQGKTFGNCFVYAGVKKGSANETLNIIRNCISKFRDLNKKDLEETKEQLIGNFELLNERSDRIALSLIQEEIVGDAGEHYKYQERISKVKLEDVKNIARLKNHAFVVLN